MAKGPINVETAKRVAQLAKRHSAHVSAAATHRMLHDTYETASQLHSKAFDESGYQHAIAGKFRALRSAEDHEKKAASLAKQIRDMGGEVLSENYDPTDEEDEAPDFDEEDVYDDLPDDETATRRAVLEDRISKMTRRGDAEGARQLRRELDSLNENAKRFLPAASMDYKHATERLLHSGFKPMYDIDTFGHPSKGTAKINRNPKSSAVSISVKEPGSSGAWNVVTKKGAREQGLTHPSDESK